MSQVISHPFRLGLDGRVVTVDGMGDAGIAEQVNAFIQTELGERPLSLSYGSPDPTFENQFDSDALVAGIYQYCPEVSIESLDARFLADGKLEVLVGFKNAQS